MLFDIGVVFLDDVDFLNLGGEIQDHLIGQRVGEAQFKVRGTIAKYFAGIQVTISRANDA